ncbi:acetylesterase, partial [Halomonas sp. ND22Bw]|uniref:hypothetical protein n=1 Tax=Halomonas sp. ND22Bw TaxID=2054178 RepID=UPI000D2B4C22
MTEIDPDIARFVATLQADWGRHPPLYTLSMPEARAVAEQVRARWSAGGPEMAETRDVMATTTAGPLRLRLYV